MKLSTIKRKAAAKVFYFLFSALNNLMYQLEFNHLTWGRDIFTPKEIEYINNMKQRLHQESQRCLHFAWRLEGKR